MGFNRVAYSCGLTVATMTVTHWKVQESKKCFSLGVRMSPLVFGVCPNPKAVAAINTSEGMDLPGSEGVEKAGEEQELPSCVPFV